MDLTNKRFLTIVFFLLTAFFFKANAGNWVPIAVGNITIFVPTELKGTPDAYTIDEDQVSSFDVLANDEINDLNAVTIVAAKIFSGPNTTKGSVLVETNSEGNQVVKYTPQQDYFGTDFFHYAITDNNGDVSDDVLVTVTINPVNDAPRFSTAVTVSGGKISPSDINTLIVEIPTLSDVIDVDNSNEELTVEILTDWANSDGIGRYSLVGGAPDYASKQGIVFFQPTSHSLFNYSTFGAQLMYKVTDPSGASTNHVINYLMTHDLDYVATLPDSVSVEQDNSIVIDITANDASQSVPVTLGTSPQNGTLVNNNNGTVTYKPSPGYVGQDSFTYQLQSATQTSSETEVAIKVTEEPLDVVVNQFAWQPEEIFAGQSTSFVWDIENVDHCKSVSSGSNQEITRAASGSIGPYVYTNAEVHTTKWYCVDKQGNRYPTVESEYLTATRKVKANSTSTMVKRQFAWIPAKVAVGQITSFHWNIENAQNCYAVSDGANPSPRAPSGNNGQHSYLEPGVHLTQWYCLDEYGNRLPEDPTRYLEATRTVTDGIQSIKTELLGVPISNDENSNE